MSDAQDCDHADPLAARKEEMAARFGPRISDAAEPLLRQVSLDGFMQADASTIDWALYPLIPRCFLTLLGAHGGAGKSSLALLCVAHSCCGASWAGLHPGGVLKTLFVSLEDSGELVRYRLRRICEAYGLDPALVQENVTVVDCRGDGSLMIEVNDMGLRTVCPTALMREVQILASGMDLIVIDNASDAYSGNEIERRSVRTFCRALTELGIENNAAVLLLAHIDKQAARSGAAGNSYSGSTAWHNSARSRLALIPQEDGSIELVHEKNNLGPRADTIRLTWDDHGVLVPVKVDPLDLAQSAFDDREAALYALTAALGAGITVPTGTSGPATSWHALEPVPELGAQFRGKEGKRRLFAALLALQRQGAIARATYKTSQRNERERWELTQSPSETGLNGVPTYSPIPPSATNARTEVRVSGTNSTTNATNATNAADYRRAKAGDL